MEILENKNNMSIQKIIEDESEKIMLVSYNSIIAIYNITRNRLYLNNRKINVNSEYKEVYKCSQATLKQLKHFINDYVEDNYYTTFKEFEKRIHKNAYIFLTEL